MDVTGLINIIAWIIIFAIVIWGLQYALNAFKMPTPIWWVIGGVVIIILLLVLVGQIRLPVLIARHG